MITPKIKITFLGSGSAFTIGESNYHSNLLIEDLKTSKKLLIDCGSDARFSMQELGLSFSDVDAIYISHIHADHTGGLEWLGFTRYFSKYKIPDLYASNEIVKPLWGTLKAGIETLEDKPSSIDTFFNIKVIDINSTFKWLDYTFELERAKHVVNNGIDLPCYGLKFKVNDSYIYFTSDSRFMFEEKKELFNKATVIFHDCETSSFKSGVHAHYSELLTIPKHIRQKMWLYHYNIGDKPDPEKDNFKGFVSKAQNFWF